MLTALPAFCARPGADVSLRLEEAGHKLRPSELRAAVRMDGHTVWRVDPAHGSVTASEPFLSQTGGILLASSPGHAGVEAIGNHDAAATRYRSHQSDADC